MGPAVDCDADDKTEAGAEAEPDADTGLSMA
jgi:hypothetical protein